MNQHASGAANDAAIIVPIKGSFIGAIREALLASADMTWELFTDGDNVAWLPRRMPGWFPIHPATIDEAAKCAA